MSASLDIKEALSKASYQIYNFTSLATLTQIMKVSETCTVGVKPHSCVVRNSGRPMVVPR